MAALGAGDAVEEAAAVAVEVETAPRDRFGLGLRPELAAEILESSFQLDLVEVIADDLFKASQRELDALRLISQELELTLHGVGMGLASAHPADQDRLDALARLVDLLACGWSEHLSFVRAGGTEIGHLAAPPRTQAVIDGLFSNVMRARATIGSMPALENIATLIEPPCSTMSESEWINASLAATQCPLLLDLHNLYANAVNSGHDPLSLLHSVDVSLVSQIHLSGGCGVEHAINGEIHRRLLDDHLHDPPPIVYDMLADTAVRTDRPLTVIIERDGRYPDFPVLLAQIETARAAVRRGREMKRAVVR